MQAKTLIVIFTPLQFLNAISYIKQTKQASKMVVLTGNLTNIKQIQQIDKDKICYYPLRNLLWLHNEILWFVKFTYISFLSKLNNYKCVVIGNFNNVVAYHLACLFQRKSKEIILIDDGLATINIYLERNQYFRLNNHYLFGGKFIMAFHKLFYQRLQIERVAFFTSFKLEKLQPIKFDYIIKQCVLNNTVVERIDEIWFIGSPLTENMIIEERTFFDYMENVKTYAQKQSCRLVYILHRFEKIKPEINCIQFDKPIEVHLASLNSFPKEIITFYSSAIVNIASQYPDLKCSYINLYKDNNKLDRLKNVYEFLNNNENLSEFSF